MRCRYAPVHDEVRGICDALGLDYDRIATDRAGMLWAGEGMPHRFDACCEISDIARRLRAQCRDVASRSESPGPPARRADRRAAFYIEGECAPWRGNETAAR